MRIIAAIIAVVLPLAWLVSEFKASKPTRITLGVLVLIALPLVTCFLHQAAWHYDRLYYNSAINGIPAIIDAGKSEELKRIIEQYSKIEEAKMTFRGSSFLMIELDKLNKQNTEQSDGEY